MKLVATFLVAIFVVVASVSFVFADCAGHSKAQLVKNQQQTMQDQAAIDKPDQSQDQAAIDRPDQSQDQVAIDKPDQVAEATVNTLEKK
jgi:hypothetical protein